MRKYVNYRWNDNVSGIQKANSILEKLLLRHTNVLRRALITANSDKGLYYRGRSLAGGRHLINTYKSVQNNQVNHDRFRTIKVDPRVSAGFSIAIDCSGSMDCNTRRFGGAMTMSRWENVAVLLNVILPICDRLKIQTHAGLCDYTRSTNGAGTKGNLIPIIRPDSKWDTKWLPELFCLSMSGGTHIATYANTAIEMAEQMTCDQKVAMFITDGHCSSINMLESLKQQARRKGITLVGVGIGDVSRETAERFPNGIYATNAKTLGEHLLKHLAEIIKKGGIENGVMV